MLKRLGRRFSVYVVKPKIISIPQQYTKANTNNQTTSTKCQYHAANSNKA